MPSRLMPNTACGVWAANGSLVAGREGTAAVRLRRGMPRLTPVAGIADLRQQQQAACNHAACCCHGHKRSMERLLLGDRL